METNPFRAQRAREEAAARARKAGGAEGGADRGDEGAGAGGPAGRSAGNGAAPAAGRGPTAWVTDRVRGQVWYSRAPLLLVLFWIWKDYPGDPLHTSIFDGISLGFHEMGHAAFVVTGNRLLITAGGTLFELGVPLAAAAYLVVRQRDPFGATVCLFWLGTALWHTAAYAGDARAQALPLVSPFGPVDVDSHDWTYMLMRFGRLSRDAEIAATLRSAARVFMVDSMVLGAWILWLMARTARADAEPPTA